MSVKILWEICIGLFFSSDWLLLLNCKSSLSLCSHLLFPLFLLFVKCRWKLVGWLLYSVNIASIERKISRASLQAIAKLKKIFHSKYYGCCRHCTEHGMTGKSLQRLLLTSKMCFNGNTDFWDGMIQTEHLDLTHTHTACKLWTIYFRIELK